MDIHKMFKYNIDILLKFIYILNYNNNMEIIGYQI